MTKKLTVIFLLLIFFLTGCSKSGTEEDFLSETSEKAAEFTLANEKFALDKFIKGSWEGRCSDNKTEKVAVDFQISSRVKFTYYSPDLDFGSGYEQGLYEIVDEKTIKLHYPASGEVIEITKINEDEISVGGSGKSIIYGCNLDRTKN